MLETSLKDKIAEVKKNKSIQNKYSSRIETSEKTLLIIFPVMMHLEIEEAVNYKAIIIDIVTYTNIK